MSLRFFTGFNGIDTPSLTKRFEYATNVTVGAVGRFGQGVTIDASGELSYVFPEALGAYTIGASVRPVDTFAPDSTDTCTILYCNSRNAVEGQRTQLQLKYDKVLETFQLIGPQPTASTIWTGTLGAFPVDAWYFVEMQVVVSATSGTIALRIDGASVFSGTGLNTRGTSSTATTTRIGIGGFGVGPLLCDCVYVTDGTGTSPHNGFLDPCRADVVFTAADQSVDFTPLSGTNESNIDDGNTPDDDATYNSSNVTDDTDLFTVSGYSAPGAEILGYSVVAQAMATVGDGRQLAAVWDDGTSDIGPALNLTTAYREAAHVVPEDPTTYASAGVASTAINALRIGYTVAT